MNTETKYVLSEFTKRAAQRIHDKKQVKKSTLHIESLDIDIIVRGLSEEEIFECQDMNTDATPNRGDKYSVYIGTVEPNLKAVAKSLLENGDISEALDVVSIFELSEINGIVYSHENGKLRVKGTSTTMSYSGHDINYLNHFICGKTYVASGEYIVVRTITVDGKTMYPKSSFTITPDIVQVNIYVQINVGKTVDKLLDLQVELNDQHEYVQYKPTTTISLPAGFGGVGNVSDIIYFENGSAYNCKRYLSGLLDGTQNIITLEPYQKSKNTVHFRYVNSQIKKSGTGIYDKFIYMYNWNTDVESAYPVEQSIDVRILKSRIGSWDDSLPIQSQTNLFKNWLKDNPIEYCVEMQTPEIIDIATTTTGQAFLQAQTFYPFTHISTTAPDNAKPTISAKIKQF